MVSDITTVTDNFKVILCTQLEHMKWFFLVNGLKDNSIKLDYQNHSSIPN